MALFSETSLQRNESTANVGYARCETDWPFIFNSIAMTGVREAKAYRTFAAAVITFAFLQETVGLIIHRTLVWAAFLHIVVRCLRCVTQSLSVAIEMWCWRSEKGETSFFAESSICVYHWQRQRFTIDSTQITVDCLYSIKF